MPGVYMIFNKENKKTYIGSTTVDFDVRHQQRIYKALAPSSKLDYPIHRAIRKYGPENFALVPLEEMNDSPPKDIFSAEQWYLNNFKTFAGKGGYNLSKKAAYPKTKTINEENNRYGRLVVLYRDGKDNWGTARWACGCDCGKTVTVNGTSLRSGHTKSCGCLSAQKASKRLLIDLAGKRFGKLSVLSRYGTNNNNSSTWLCKCECGNRKVVSSPSLRMGTLSCGCLQRKITRNASRTLNKHQVKFIKYMWLPVQDKGAITLKNIGKAYGVARTTIGAIKREQNWSHI